MSEPDFDEDGKFTPLNFEDFSKHAGATWSQWGEAKKIEQQYLYTEYRIASMGIEEFLGDPSLNYDSVQEFLVEIAAGNFSAGTPEECWKKHEPKLRDEARKYFPGL